MSRGPGRWQVLILARLVEVAYFGLSDWAMALQGESWTRAEYSAIHRAARTLAESGRCQIALLRSEKSAPCCCLTFVARPGSRVNGQPFSELSVERDTNETRSTLRGSYRQIAKATGVSHTTVWRTLRKPVLS